MTAETSKVHRCQPQPLVCNMSWACAKKPLIAGSKTGAECASRFVKGCFTYGSPTCVNAVAKDAFSSICADRKEDKKRSTAVAWLSAHVQG